MTRIKICGITNLNDAYMAVDLGVDAIGFVFATSPRHISPEQARAIIRKITPLVTTVGVFMDEDIEEVKRITDYTGVDAIQLHGSEPMSYCAALGRRVIKRIKVDNGATTESLFDIMRAYHVSAFLLDPGAGSGEAFNWSIARNLCLPIIIAGGLEANNVGQVIRMLRPYGVDVSSGIEKIAGLKDREKVKSFIEEVRRCSLPVS